MPSESSFKIPDDFLVSVMVLLVAKGESLRAPSVDFVEFSVP